MPSRTPLAVKPLALAIALAFCAAPVLAEEKELAAVHVTSRLSREDVRDVPFGVSVMRGEELENRRILSAEQLLRETPGVDVNSWGDYNNTNIRIRGVGNLYQTGADDASVVINVDGVPFFGQNASLNTFDVERVEVLKGPQGTLFGRNSMAGAVNITSRRPTREAKGYARAEFGKDKARLQEFAFGGPLG